MRLSSSSSSRKQEAQGVAGERKAISPVKGHISSGSPGKQSQKGTTEDEMAGWHHRLIAYEFECTPGVGDGQGGLACYDSWGLKESDTTEGLN